MRLHGLLTAVQTGGVSRSVCARKAIADWRTAYQHFSSSAGSGLHLRTDEFTWKSAIKILSDCFIKTNKASGQLIVSPFNPLVRDFVITLIQESVELQRELIEGSYFPEQLVEVFGKSSPQRIRS